MDFSEAFTKARAGHRIERTGWNGMYVVKQNGYPDGIPVNSNTAEATGLEEGTVCVFSPYLMIRTADGSFAPWFPSNGDLFADDWTCCE